jgi:hypothetical protein
MLVERSWLPYPSIIGSFFQSLTTPIGRYFTGPERHRVRRRSSRRIAGTPNDDPWSPSPVDTSDQSGVAGAVTFFQIAIALGAVAALTRVRLVWVGSLVLGVAGVLLFASRLLR